MFTKINSVCLKIFVNNFDSWCRKSFFVSLFLLLKGAPFSDIKLYTNYTKTTSLIKHLQNLSSVKQRIFLNEIENKLRETFQYQDVPKHYRAFSKTQKSNIFTLFLVINRNKTERNIHLPKPLPYIIAKETLGLASIMNIVPYKSLCEIVDQTIDKPVVNEPQKFKF